MAQTLYTWNFKIKHDRGHMWYIIAFACVIGLVIWGFLTRQYGMSFVVMLLAGVFFFVENNSADDISITVNELGISVGETFYDFGKIRSFCFIYDGKDAKLLRLKINKNTLSNLDLDVDNTIALDLKPLLASYLKEDERGELSLADKFIKATKL